MEIRYSPREPGGGPPSIYIDRPAHLDRFGGHGCSSSQSRFAPSSIPMSIPHHTIAEDDVAPPPLPPPKLLYDHPQYGSRHHHTSSLDSGSSWGSSRHSPDQDRPGIERKSSDTGTIRPGQKDEGYHSLNSASSVGSQSSVPKLFMSHDRFQFNQPAQSHYDNSLLKKLDPRRTLDNHSPPRRSGLSASFGNSEGSRFGASDRLRNQLPTLSLPTDHGHASIDSPMHSVRSGTSPHPICFSRAPTNDYRSPIEPSDLESLPFARTRRNNSGSQLDDAMASTPNSVEQNTDEMDFAMEDASLSPRMHLDEPQHQGTRHKRRALSPPDEDTPMSLGAVSMDMARYRDGASRGSPAPRLTANSQGSISSMSSTTGRSGSYNSTLSLAGTSMSSVNSHGRLSPVQLSPSSALSPVDICRSPFTASTPLGPSPRAALARLSHQRQLSGAGAEPRSATSPRKASDVAKGSISKMQGGFFMCECCPKKPKKFEKEEELRAHEAEKQYGCSFCGNRFKNKNEAERHQNSLHVRRHSWSCSALLEHGYDHAFHESTNRPGEADVCGFCGEEFARSGTSGRTRQATEQDWDIRLRHLQEVHKFRECNSSKKFFRADHFRQHLKHSHAGTSGKWTNMLENACMLSEEPPIPQR